MAIDLSKFILRFIDEAQEHLERLNQGLVSLEQNQAHGEDINALFRSAHTIKGSARMLKLSPINELAHAIEDLLSVLRSGERPFDPALGLLLHEGVDALTGLVDTLAQTRDAQAIPANPPELLAKLRAAVSAPSDSAMPNNAAIPGATPAPFVTAAPAPATPQPTPSPSAPAAPATPEQRATFANTQIKTADSVRIRLDKVDALVKLMGEVVSSHARMQQRLNEIAHIHQQSANTADHPLHAALGQFQQHLKDTVQHQTMLMTDLHDKALVMRMLPLAIVFEPASRTVRELARTIGKQAECVIEGSQIELDRQIIDRLSDPITHLLRNAIDHGIEPPEQREHHGKRPLGRITLSAYQDGAWVIVTIQDDGAGIPVAPLRAKAVQKGFLTANAAENASDAEILDLIFEPGFSTSPIITDLSGRGVGMDVVKRTVVDELQGSVAVHTRIGQGTTFELRFPLSLALMRILLVEAGPYCLGFTAGHVAELLRIAPSALFEIAERQAIILRNEFVPVIALSGLLEQTAGPDQATDFTAAKQDLLLVIVRMRSEKLALVVDTLVDEQDMVVKSLPPHVQRLGVISGVVVTGRNELVCVLQVPYLFERLRRLRGLRPRDAETQQQLSHWRVLVVDDSLNTREIEKDVLEASGYAVTLAEDGQDGLNKALADTFDAILTDVEMPQMDGFTLTARLREQPRYQKTPIIIITSREREEDKRRGMNVGADAYIVKGDFDQHNLVDTLRALLG